MPNLVNRPWVPEISETLVQSVAARVAGEASEIGLGKLPKLFFRHCHVTLNCGNVAPAAA